MTGIDSGIESSYGSLELSDSPIFPIFYSSKQNFSPFFLSFSFFLLARVAMAETLPAIFLFILETIREDSSLIFLFSFFRNKSLRTKQTVARTEREDRKNSLHLRLFFRLLLKSTNALSFARVKKKEKKGSICLLHSPFRKGGC